MRTLEYAFGTDGNPGTLLRETVRTYVTKLNGYCYVNLAGTDTACTPDIVPGSAIRLFSISRQACMISAGRYQRQRWRYQP